MSSVPTKKGHKRSVAEGDEALKKGRELLGAVVTRARKTLCGTRKKLVTRTKECDPEDRGVSDKMIYHIECGAEHYHEDRTLRVLSKAFAMPEWILLGLADRVLSKLYADGKCSRPEREPLERCLAEIKLDRGTIEEVLEFFDEHCFRYLPLPGAPASAVSVAELMEEIRLQQGKLVSQPLALALVGREQAALRGLLAKADEPELRPLWAAPLPTEPIAVEAPPTLPGFVRRVLSHVGRFRAEAGPAERVGRAIIDMIHRLEEEWARIPYDYLRWSLDDQLFAEFVLGLAYVETTIHVARTVHVRPQDVRWQKEREALFVPSLDTSSYAGGLAAALDGHKFVLERVNDLYAGKTEALWLRIWEAMEQGRADNSDLPAALRSAVSLRSPTPVVPQTTTPAQLLHWLGWGGDAAIFEGLDAGPAAGNALLETLGQKRYHGFNWHNIQKHDRSIRDPFESRQKHFGETALSLLRYAARCTASILLLPDLRGADDAVRMWADAVGPTARMEQMIYIAMGTLLGEERALPRFDLVLTDVSPFSLSELGRSPPFVGAALVWRDLNVGFPGEPGEAIGEELAPLLRPDAYDVYSCSVALHQIADGTSGRERLRRILSFAVRFVRPGGVISLPDVGPGVFVQVYLLPVNICDREGGWGCATFFDEYRFSDVACRQRDGEPFDRSAAADNALYKTAIPLLDLRSGTPECLDRDALSIYEYVPYIVVTMLGSDLLDLDERWHAHRDLRARQQIVRDELRRQWPKTVGLQQQIRERWLR